MERREEQNPMIKATKNHLLFAVAGVFALAAVGCVSEDSTPAAPIRDASFVGYSNPDTKQTTCGNCHVDVQAEWAQTKHANAWADLQASGHASEMCNKCHTVNGGTNGTGDTTGFFTVSADAQRFYRDVQCESCHGAGANHISAPGESQPIPTFKVDNTYADGCTACHNSAHHPFAEQLAASKHGEMPNWEGAAGGCQVNCHTVWGAQTQMAARGPFREMGIAPLTTTLPPGLTCQLCHEPHDAVDNPAQLRLSLSTMDTAQHACGKCHNRNPVPTLSSSRGPHSAQAGVVFGTAGWVPASFGNISGPARHGTQEGSCTTCHMSSGPVNDAAGNFVVQNTGHTFTVLPCLNAAATATGGVDTSAACTPAQESFAACATSNCHGSEASAEHAMELLQAEVMGKVRTLWVDVNGDGNVDRFPIDSGFVPLVFQRDSGLATALRQFQPCSGASYDATTGAMTEGGCLDSLVGGVIVIPWGSKKAIAADAVITAAEGARFNALLAASPNQHGDGSKGVHNPSYVRTLLDRTIALMRSTYSYLPQSSAPVQTPIARSSRRR
jgi:hypothetical protein